MIQISVNNTYGHMHDLWPQESHAWWQLITAQLISLVVIVSEGQQHAFWFSNSLNTCNIKELNQYNIDNIHRIHIQETYILTKTKAQKKIQTKCQVSKECKILMSCKVNST
jgi:hypothetical protein